MIRRRTNDGFNYGDGCNDQKDLIIMEIQIARDCVYDLMCRGMSADSFLAFFRIIATIIEN